MGARQKRIANHRIVLQKQLEEEKRKEREAAISKLMGLGSNDHTSFSPQSSPSTPSSKSLVVDNDNDILHLLLQPYLHQSNNTFIKKEDEEEKKMRTQSRNNQPMYSPFMVRPNTMMSSTRKNRSTRGMMQSPTINQTKDSTHRECSDNGDTVIEEKMLTPKTYTPITFHNCFNVHNEPKISVSESSKASTSTRPSKRINKVERKNSNKKLKSSILIGDDEDASDDEYDEDPIWNRRRPSEGQWMEPVMYEMAI